MQDEFKNNTIEQLESLVYDFEDILYTLGLTSEQLHWLFYYMCVKDDSGRWHGLDYCNYKVIFDGDRIWIELDNPLYTTYNRKTIPFKDKYLVKGAFPSEQENVSEYVIFPKYTGYEKVLNGEAEEFE
jgi:hypothetical protein